MTVFAELITIDARMATGPAWTTPRSSGGPQNELRTWLCATYARAIFITSQPAASLKSFSESSIDIRRIIVHECRDENSEQHAMFYCAHLDTAPATGLDRQAW